MLHSAERLKDDTILRYDIVVIGSGPAAFSFLLQFIKQITQPITIALIESGVINDQSINKHETSNVQEQYQGEIVGWIKKNDPDYLTHSRFRSYGGTSNTWSGWCCPLEEYDIKERSIRKGYEWPLNYQELKYYYLIAQEICDLGAFEYESKYWVENHPTQSIDVMPLKDSSMQTKILQFNPLCFQKKYHQIINNFSYLDIYHNANLIGFTTHQLSDSKKKIKTAIVRTIINSEPASTLYFEANQFILATGGIETTRLLLLSNLGNSTGQLGLNFIEHPYLWIAGKFTLNRIPEKIKNLYFSQNLVTFPKQQRILGMLTPTYEYIESQMIGNFRIILGGFELVPGTINVCWEQLPNLNSQITLSENMSPDIFGLKRIKIHSQLSETDKQTIKTLIWLGKETLKNLDYGIDFVIPNLSQDPLEWDFFEKIVPGNHPMGTTRMSVDPMNGVVNSDCRMHEVDNLYIVSSSNFPTGGYANPTLTIIALAARLADHFKKILM